MHYFTAFIFYLGVLGRCSCFKSPPRPFLPSIRSSTTPSRLQYKDEDDIEFHPTTFAGEELIPKGQLPIAEYRELLELPFFDWPTKEGLDAKLLILYSALTLLISYPISCATYTLPGYLLPKLTSSNLGSLSITLLFVLRLFSGWSYVASRLKSDYIVYEETGWYDCAVEKKSLESRIRDKMTYRESVEPAVTKMKGFLLGLSVAWVLSCASFTLSTHAKPMFNEYQPDFLNSLITNDMMAGFAAEQSHGRPTYCDSRYYKVLAGSAQGCNTNKNTRGEGETIYY
ncbi:hypothetical protein TrVE_jg9946 [Triparma verrucosa]|uniref:Uncharacterized protein n=1 Tax=Triparma verrucosa TaxID=1606542 RepID=A0A9W7EY78_9STRA|nr:hypothetical protein TrVE_jg9946 [Triparma verrucosa]